MVSSKTHLEDFQAQVKMLLTIFKVSNGLGLAEDHSLQTWPDVKYGHFESILQVLAKKIFMRAVLSGIRCTWRYHAAESHLICDISNLISREEELLTVLSLLNCIVKADTLPFQLQVWSLYLGPHRACWIIAFWISPISQAVDKRMTSEPILD